MDNQQVRRALRLSWLGGIIDGEGCLTFNVRVKNGHEQQTPLLSIDNQDPYILETAVEILKAEGIGPWVSRSSKTEKNHGMTTLRISGLRRIHTALPIIVPYLVSKRREAELMYEFCVDRLSRSPYVGSSMGVGTPPTGLQRELMAQIKALKKARYLRDYTPAPDWPPIG